MHDSAGTCAYTATHIVSIMPKLALVCACHSSCSTRSSAQVAVVKPAQSHVWTSRSERKSHEMLSDVASNCMALQIVATAD